MAGNSITITHNTPEVMQKLGQLPGYLGQTLDRAMATGAAHVARSARDKAPKAETELTNATQAERVSLLEHHIRSAKQYASYVEGGTGPNGQPTLARVIAWIRRKRITPRTPGMSERDLGFAIKRKIKARGTPKQPYMQPALTETAPKLDALFRAAVARGLAAIDQGRAL
jgi:hypothetical protein